MNRFAELMKLLFSTRKLSFDINQHYLRFIFADNVIYFKREVAQGKFRQSCRSFKEG
jgi:hypothetical protein